MQVYTKVNGDYWAVWVNNDHSKDIQSIPCQDMHNASFFCVANYTIRAFFQDTKPSYEIGKAVYAFCFFYVYLISWWIIHVFIDFLIAIANQWVEVCIFVIFIMAFFNDFYVVKWVDVSKMFLELPFYYNHYVNSKCFLWWFSIFVVLLSTN